jgi:hypothetical protein
LKSSSEKQEFIKLRAEGRSFAYIAKELSLSKSTCSKWEAELEDEISLLKEKELHALYEAYQMKKEARIKRLGDTLSRIEDALASVDLLDMPPEKLLDFKLKYAEALQKEYLNPEASIKLKEDLQPKDIVKALADLLNRIREGSVTAEQAQKESTVLSNLLKAYETTELKEKVEMLESVLDNR